MLKALFAIRDANDVYIHQIVEIIFFFFYIKIIYSYTPYNEKVKNYVSIYEVAITSVKKTITQNKFSCASLLGTRNHA